MKKVLLGMMSLLSMTAMAQDFTVNDTVSAGDSQFFWTADSNAANLAGTTGSGVTWDYSGLEMYINQTNTDTVTWASDSPDYSDYPNAIYNDILSQGTSSFLTNTADSVISYGYKFVAEGMDVKIMYDVNELKYLEIPMMLNDTYNDSVEGTVDVDGNTGTILGDADITLDGTGTLILGDSTLSNITRVHLSETLSTTVTIPFVGPVSGTVTRNFYTYYNLGVENMPVFIHATIDVASSAFSGSYKAVYTSVEVTPFSASIGDEQIEGQLSVYPNPATDVVAIEMPTNIDELVIVNALGQTIETISNPNQKEQFDVSRFETGVYFVQIKQGDAVKTKKLIIK